MTQRFDKNEMAIAWASFDAKIELEWGLPDTAQSFWSGDLRPAGGTLSQPTWIAPGLSMMVVLPLDISRIINLRTDLMLRRHHYAVNTAGGFSASQLTSDYVVENGISLPTKTARLHTRAGSLADLQKC